ncbi:hypothetical protein ACQZ6F_27425 [Rhizobium sp. A22-96]
MNIRQVSPRLKEFPPLPTPVRTIRRIGRFYVALGQIAARSLGSNPRLGAGIALVGLIAFGSSFAPAHADEWGCEVLLCAASDNPSWHGVESCHPPMQRLITAMGEPGFSWPTCTEGGTGKPGYERFADCPTGWQPAQGEEDSGHGLSEDLSLCTRTVNVCGSKQSDSDNRGGNDPIDVDRITRVYSSSSTCEYSESIARPLREQPYYFDLPGEQGGAPERHYFDLEE